jgi:hypothetical protein
MCAGFILRRAGGARWPGRPDRTAPESPTKAATWCSPATSATCWASWFRATWATPRWPVFSRVTTPGSSGWYNSKSPVRSWRKELSAVSGSSAGSIPTWPARNESLRAGHRAETAQRLRPQACYIPSHAQPAWLDTSAFRGPDADGRNGLSRPAPRSIRYYDGSRKNQIGPPCLGSPRYLLPIGPTVRRGRGQ